MARIDYILLYTLNVVVSFTDANIIDIVNSVVHFEPLIQPEREIHIHILPCFRFDENLLD